MARRRPAADAYRMGPSDLLLTELLSLAGLIGVTIAYGEIIQRRAQRRRVVEAEHRAVEEAGLRGMVRVFLAER